MRQRKGTYGGLSRAEDEESVRGKGRKEGEKIKRCWHDECWLGEPVCVWLACVTGTKCSDCSRHSCAALYPCHPSLSLFFLFFISLPAAGEFSGLESPLKVIGLLFEGKFPNLAPHLPLFFQTEQGKKNRAKEKRQTSGFLIKPWVNSLVDTWCAHTHTYTHTHTHTHTHRQYVVSYCFYAVNICPFNELHHFLIVYIFTLWVFVSVEFA